MILAVILFHFGRQVAAFDDIAPDDSGSKGCDPGYGMKDDNCGMYYVESRRAANPRGAGDSFPQYFTSFPHAGHGFAGDQDGRARDGRARICILIFSG